MKQGLYYFIRIELSRLIMCKRDELIRIVSIVLTALCLCSCTNNGNISTTKIIEVKNKIAHYSLTYPTKYKKYGPRIWSPGICNLSLTAGTTMITIPNPDPNKTGTVNASHVPAAIDIDVYEPVDNRDAIAQLEFILENESDDSEFQLIDRSTIEISGMTAQQAIYYTSGPFLFKNTPNRLIRAIYFDHNGYVWELSFFAEESMEEAVEEDFENILSTFKILD
jgi:hypothetical protein